MWICPKCGESGVPNKHECPVVGNCPDCGVGWTLGREVDGRVHTPGGMDCLRRQNAALRERLEWRPFETAPKDGTDLLVFHPEAGVSIVVYHWTHYGDGPHRWQTTDGTVLTYAPTHWMPLPDAPEVSDDA